MKRPLRYRYRPVRRVIFWLHHRLWRLCSDCRKYDAAGREMGFWK